jgi:hypothetical protein
MNQRSKRNFDEGTMRVETNSLCHGQQIISVHAFIFTVFVVCTYTARVDHDPALLVGFRIKQVVAF